MTFAILLLLALLLLPAGVELLRAWFERVKAGERSTEQNQTPAELPDRHDRRTPFPFI